MTEVGVRGAGRHEEIVVRDRLTLRVAVAFGPVRIENHAPADWIDLAPLASSTSTFCCRRRIHRIGDATSPGDSEAVAT